MNWAKFNPRSDVKRPSWFRVEHSLLDDPEFLDFTHEELVAWFYVMAQANRKNSAEVRLHYVHAEVTRRLSRPGLDSAIQKLQSLGVITVLVTDAIANVTHPSRARYEPVTDAYATNERTYETNGTERDETDGSHAQSRVTPPASTALIWEGYREAYLRRWKVEPTRNARVNANLKQFSQRVPTEEAPAIARFYVSHNNTFYVSKQHPVSLLLQDAESLRTQWQRGAQVTHQEARDIERRQSTANAFAPLLAEAKEREASRGGQ